MKAKALLRTNSSWINVTPSQCADAAQLQPSDERAWQRDIDKFLKKAPKEIKLHSPRETDVLRVPASVQDGYFRVVLCAGDGSKNVLCPSPVFRIASTSTSSSSIKGASLATLPMEIGIKVFSSTALTAAGAAISPAASVLQGQLNQYKPGFLVQEAGSTAYGATGIEGKVEAADQQHSRGRELMFESDPSKHVTYDDNLRPQVVGSPSGPEAPFPIRMSGKIVPGTGRSTVELCIPTTNLATAPEDIDYHLLGVYIGWTTVSTKQPLQPGILDTWHPAIIIVAPCSYTSPSIAPKKTVKAHLLHDFNGARLETLDGKMTLLILDFLRPAPFATPDLDRDSNLEQIASDIAIAQASLARPAWSAANSINQLKLTKSSRSMTERYVDMRQSGQRQVDRVPFHKAGIRAPGAAQRDRMVVHGNGGVYILR